MTRALLFLRRLDRAWSYWRRLGYSWRLSWIKAGWSTTDSFNEGFNA